MPGSPRSHSFSTSGPPEGKPCFSPAPTNGHFLHPSKVNGDAANEIESMSVAGDVNSTGTVASETAEAEAGFGSVRMVSKREIMHKGWIHKSSFTDMNSYFVIFLQMCI